MNKIIKLDEWLRVGDRTVLRCYSFAGGETVKVTRWEKIKGESLT
jgi:hypothetical protein